MQNQQDSGNRHVLSTGPLYLKFDPPALYLSENCEIWDWSHWIRIWKWPRGMRAAAAASCQKPMVGLQHNKLEMYCSYRWHAIGEILSQVA